MKGGKLEPRIFALQKLEVNYIEREKRGEIRKGKEKHFERQKLWNERKLRMERCRKGMKNEREEERKGGRGRGGGGGEEGEGGVKKKGE